MNGPYEIELVPADKGWILERIAREIKAAADNAPERFRVSIRHEPTDTAELTFFLPESAFRPLKRSIPATYLAHKEDHEGAKRLFEHVARASDFCITSSRRYKAVLEADGARKVFHVPLGTDTRVFIPKLKLGVVGRTYETGRKGEHLLAPSMSVPYVEFAFTGSGWPAPAAAYDEDELAAFYQDIDYLVVPSLIEGGPAPLLEALSAGCPVIAPSDIGLVEDFPHIPYERGNAADLKRVIEELLQSKLLLRQSVISCEWPAFARRHLEIFAKRIETERVRRTRSSIAPSAEPLAQPQLKIAMVTHGTENTSLGGPTVRIRALCDRLLEGRHVAAILHNPTADELNGFDIVHVFNSWPLESALKTMLAAKRSGKRVVFSPIAMDLAYLPVYMELVGWALDRLDPESLRGWSRSLADATPVRHFYSDNPSEPLEGVEGHFQALRDCIALADHVVFLSEHERRFIHSIGASPLRSTIVENASDDIHLMRPDPDAFRRKYNLGRYVLSVGRLEFRKNQALLALALRGLDVKLILIGAVGDSDYAPLLDRCCGENVERIGRVEDRQLLASAYAGAEALVFPTWVEGAPLVAIEAGLVGTPLILSNMAAERDYFGDFAEYVHPADIEAIRAAVTRFVQQPEPVERRAARKLFCTQRYTLDRHVDATLTVYRETMKSPATARALAMEISALVHFLSTRMPLTGVPTVELNVLRALLDLHPGMELFAYFGRDRGFRRIDAADIVDFNADKFYAKYYSVPTDDGVVRRLVVQLGDGPPEHAPKTENVTTVSRVALSARAVAKAKWMIRGLPQPLRAVAVSSVRTLMPQFDPYAATPMAARIVKRRQAARTPALVRYSWPQRPPRQSSPPSPSALLKVVEMQNRPSVPPVGGRVFTLGQGWLSNEDLLEELVQSVEKRGVALEPYVYDLSYHTGSHLSGWSDNDARFARLLRLLRRSDCVYTEARQVEQELAKLRSAYGLSYRIRTTGLTVRPLPPANRRGLPGLARRGFIMYVSSFNRRKNHDFLVNVWRELHETCLVASGCDVRLLLIGEVQEEKKYGDAAYQRQLGSLGIDILHHVSDEGLSWLYENCLFTVYPSTKEGWGIPAQESLVKGRICIVSNEVPVAHEIANAALVKLSPHDHYAWYEALRTWISNVQMREAFEAEARLYVAPTWHEIAKSFLAQ